MKSLLQEEPEPVVFILRLLSNMFLVVQLVFANAHATF